jgi:hypothetical protein
MRREVERLQARNTLLEESVMLRDVVRDVEQHTPENGAQDLFRSMDAAGVAHDTERVAQEAFSGALDAARVHRERQEPFEVYEAREVPQRTGDTLPPDMASAHATANRTRGSSTRRRVKRTKMGNRTIITHCMNSSGEYRCGWCNACEAYEAAPYVWN